MKPYIHNQIACSFIRFTAANSYSIELQSDYVDDIVFFVGRDEKKQDLILEVLATDNDLADNYLVPDEEFFNFIEELIKQAP